VTVHWSDLVGIVGVILVLLACLLLQTGRLSSSAGWYSLLDLLGSGDPGVVDPRIQPVIAGDPDRVDPDQHLRPATRVA
jgi:hypothetical protein